MGRSITRSIQAPEPNLDRPQHRLLEFRVLSVEEGKIVKKVGNWLLMAAALMALTLHADAAETQDRVLDEQPWAELQGQSKALQQMAADQGVEVSDVRIQRNLEGSVTQDQPAFGCTVSQYRRIAGIPGEVRVDATAQTCIDAWQLLEET